MNHEQKDEHSVWHYLAMVVYSEIINIIWLAVGIILVAGGFVIYDNSQVLFLKIVLGLPIFLIGISVGFFKIYEIIQTMLDVKRLKTICVICNKNGKNEEP